MPTTHTNQPHRRVLNYKYLAEWHTVDVRPSFDPAATPFGPPFELAPGEQKPAAEGRSPKTVTYLPVKKQEGIERVPALEIFVGLFEEGFLENGRIDGHTGAKVEIAVYNVWNGQKLGPVALAGTLNERGICTVQVPAATVKTWLDPAQALAGRINELLLDFSFTCPGLRIDGQVLRGQSLNRVYLYRRKVIVFLPGVFGSQLHVETPDGRTLGFPDFYNEPETLKQTMLDHAPGLLGSVGPVALGFLTEAKDQKVGGLECDAHGEPLLRPLKPQLFMLNKLPEIARKFRVYEPFDRCREARMRQLPGAPEAFRLVELHVHAYDWRCDLTEAAKTLKERLIECQRQLRALPDTDDEVALAGHSTGGVIIRRALGEANMESLVSHAFFLNVPFRGAPKALSVILTGEDPPGGQRMIPIIEASSLRAMALSMPIVYHLAPSAAYPDRVAFTPLRDAKDPRAIEEQKSDLVGFAIKTGFLPPPQFVKAAGLTLEQRALVAASSDRWHRFWHEAHERGRAATLSPWDEKNLADWTQAEMRRRDLTLQDTARVAGTWNGHLAERARKFHEESEAIAASGKWKDKAFIFYSVSPQPTTLSVHFEQADQREYTSVRDLLAAEGLDVLQLHRGEGLPKRGLENEQRENQPPSLICHQWTRKSKTSLLTTAWRVYARSAPDAGDGTVPIRSLLGFGGPAKVFKPLPAQPGHVEAPNDPLVWDRIMRTLQKRLLRDDLEQEADPLNGRAGEN
jgi:hypothetical protein